jgi:predicted glycogen debranching enzyme
MSEAAPFSGSNPGFAIGRDIANTWETSSAREWLTTNGIGGYAAGTISGANTRRYHGILVASLKPPVERVVLVAKLELSVVYLGREYHLSANEFDSGVIDPRGFQHIEFFDLHHGIPLWRFAIADALLEQRVFMAPGCNTTYVGLSVVRASAPLQISLTPLCTYRDYHSHSRGARSFVVAAGADHCSVQASDGARPIRMSISQGRFHAAAAWYWNFFHREERARGLDSSEDLFKPGCFATALDEHQQVFFVATADPGVTPAMGTEVLSALIKKAEDTIAALPYAAPPWVQQLVRAADQFIVTRDADGKKGRSVIAGYPWFSDWGRDTMIALPGLTSTLGRHDIAAQVLRTFAKFVNRGMLPNRFPDGAAAPEYNTVDATLWFFQAVNAAMTASGDASLRQDLYPVLIDIVRNHVAGTRYGIQVDPQDALLRAGEPGVQLTWMDAKVGDWVVTPRVGKPVEVNALWLNALHITLNLAKQTRDTTGKRLCADLLTRGTASFAKFWNEPAGHLFDVIDVDGGTSVDSSLRPNQILAVSLPYSALNAAQMKAVVTVCARELLTSYGLRSLSASDPGYRRSYQGDPRSRDGAYHQGTVWTWLLGAFSEAHFRVYGDARAAQAFLEPVRFHLRDACLGSVSEIFDGDAPHTPRGCFAQAWSVAEILRSWIYLESARLRPRCSVGTSS